MKLSVLMITNKPWEERTKAVHSVYEFADEIVIVETDENHRYEAPTSEKIQHYFYPWHNDFSAARNFAQAQCTGDYILWIDDDDQVSRETMEYMRGQLDNPQGRFAEKKLYLELNLHNVNSKDEVCDGIPQLRIYPNIQGAKWIGAIHETVINSLYFLGIVPIYLPDSKIIHYGYCDEEKTKEKSRNRNLPILLSQKEMENKPYYHFLIGREYQTLQDWVNAIKSFDRCIFLSKGAKEDFIKTLSVQAHYRAALCFVNDKKYKRAMIYAKKAKKKQESIFVLACAYQGDLKVEKAIKYFKEYLDSDPMPDPYGSDHIFFRKVAEERLNLLTINHHI